MGACLSKPNNNSPGGTSKPGNGKNVTVNENGANFTAGNQNRYVNNPVKTANSENATGTSRSIPGSQPQALTHHDIEVAIKAGRNCKYFHILISMFLLFFSTHFVLLLHFHFPIFRAI